MTKPTISIEIDRELVERVGALVGTSTPRETVEAALMAILRKAARREEVEALSGRQGLELSDSGMVEGPWRS